jgi:hypothetical protein
MSYCIGIVGIKISVYKLPEILRNKILSREQFEINTQRYTWRNLHLSQNYHNFRNQRANLNLNIYKIEYNERQLDLYLHLYRDHIEII